jgi:Tol biopolymer transport system component
MGGGPANLMEPRSSSGLTRGGLIGPYEIEEPIGAGGMGEVFRARDTRLHRTVAIKVLPRDRLADPERKRRFLQEARAVSALNHPNIVTLHDIGNQDGMDFLVMEYVSGQGLDALISPKGLPLVEAMGYTVQMASALAAAHAAGIVHRDIKPANAIVTSESQVKVLDFGLAKLVERAAPEDETQTQESALTEVGAVMGTIAYMSPEQASAKPLDYRTDIFSLGVVLYNMLAGTPPFRGQSKIETMHAIINGAAPALTRYPPELNDIIARALAKDPKERYQHAGDLALDIRRFQRAWETRSLPSMLGAATAAPSRRIRWAVLAGVVALGAAGAGWWAGHRGTSYTIENPLANAHFTRLTNFEGAEHDAAVSPDGKWVAFRADRDGPLDVWLTQVGTGRFSNLTKGTDNEVGSPVRSLGFSGDGSEVWLSGGVDRRLRMVPLMGGAARAFLGEHALNAAWSADGARLVYHTNERGVDPMFVADRTGTNPQQIYAGPYAGWHNHFPAWSLDGRWIYFVSGIAAANQMDIWRIAAAGGKPERLTEHNTDVAYPTPIDNRTLLYVARDRDGSGPWLWAVDVERKLTRRVSFGLERYISVASNSDGRRLVATVANPNASLWSVPILDRLAEESDAKHVSLPSVHAFAPRFGAGSLFYLSSLGAGDGLWRYKDSEVSEIWKGAEGTLLEPPGVSPDGRRLAIVLRRSGKLLLQILSADGAEVKPIAETLGMQGSASWSPDGKWIVTGANDATGPGLFKIPIDGGAPVRLVAAPALNPVWSPDGRLIVYAGAEVASTLPLLAVSPDGASVELPPIRLRGWGERVRFVPDGKALVYMQGRLSAQDFWLLDLATMKSRQLTRLKSAGAMRTFDITPDGRSIVFDRQQENSDIVLIDLPREPAGR